MRSFSRRGTGLRDQRDRRARSPGRHDRRCARLVGLLAVAAAVHGIGGAVASVEGMMRMPRAPGVALEVAGTEAASTGQPVSAAEDGRRVFAELGCQTCHEPDRTGAAAVAPAAPVPGRGPSLVGVAGSRVQLSSGATVTADDEYLRESILRPQAKVTKGYPPIMPTYEGLVTEDQLRELIVYIRSLAPARPGE